MNVIESFPHCVHLESDRITDWFTSPNTYPGYIEVGRTYRPKNILEIGVRTGYSAVALMIENPNIQQYVGIDNESYLPNSFLLAEYNIRSEIISKYPGLDITLCKADTQQKHIMDILNNHSITQKQFDLIHVDGDHTYNGARRDLEACFLMIPSGGVLVIDDYMFLRDVQRAVDTFVTSYTQKIKSYNLVRSFRGLYIIVKK